MADPGVLVNAPSAVATPPRPIFAWLALAAATLTLVVIIASAFMRHAQAGLSCVDWPACYARVVEWIPDAVPSAGVRAARMAHRFAATGVATLILGMLLVAWTQRPVWRRECAASTAAALIVTGLAILGAFTAGAKLPAVALGNLLGGYALLAGLCAAHAVAAPALEIPRTARRWALAALVLAFLQAGLGGMIGAQFATLSCPEVTNCGTWSWQQLVEGGAWNPLRASTLVDGHVVAPAGAAGLHVLHRLHGIALAATVLATAYALRRTRRPLASALLGALGAAVGAGVIAIAIQPTLPVVVLHNACAALLVALLARAAVRPLAQARA